MEEMLSLYDYLGKAAGQELGKDVFAVATAKKIVTTIKQVSNPIYSVKIVMYPKSFLNEYFSK